MNLGEGVAIGMGKGDILASPSGIEICGVLRLPPAPPAPFDRVPPPEGSGGRCPLVLALPAAPLSRFIRSNSRSFVSTVCRCCRGVTLASMCCTFVIIFSFVSTLYNNPQTLSASSSVAVFLSLSLVSPTGPFPFPARALSQAPCKEKSQGESPRDA